MFSIHGRRQKFLPNTKLYRHLSKDVEKCIVSVVEQYARTVRVMLSDIPQIQVVGYSSEFWAMKMESHASLLKAFGYKIIKLGTFGNNFFQDPNVRLDENFYMQAEIPLRHRWDSWGISRNPKAEDELFDLLVKNNEPYVFVHDDLSRNFGIKMNTLPTGVRIIRPDKRVGTNYSFFDYMKIIENATEIHCIESSFCALIESMDLQVPKFAHRYARPEAKNDYRHEFTYRTKWEVLL
jgi:hypothetical protein